MSWGDSVGTEGPGGGYGGGHNSTDGRGGGGRGTGFDGRDTPGAPNAADGRRGSSMGHDGGRASGGGGSGTGRSGSRSGQAGPGVASVSPSAVSAARDVAGVSVGALTDGAIASFTDEMDARPDPRAGFMGELDGKAMSNAQTTEQAQQSIQANAKPGMVGRTVGLLSGVLTGNPLAGLAVDTVARGINASRTAKSHNETYGTNVDESVPGNVGAQTKGTLAGFAGGRFGGLLGGRAGYALGGVPGAIVGSVGLGTAGSNIGRDMAMGPSPEAPAGTSSPGSPNGTSPGGSGTMTASRGPAPNTPGQASAASPVHGPVNLVNYGSYAEQFFA